MARRSFRPHFKRRSRFADWWLLWRVPILALIVMTVWWFGFRPAADEGEWVLVGESYSICGVSGERAAGCVVDGDTLIIGFGPQRRRIRLTGFDAPELEGACQAESARAIAARNRLHQWLEQGAFEWDGGGEPAYDQYGRELRSARRAIDSASYEYLADVMIEAELAGGSGWGSSPVDWCG